MKKYKREAAVAELKAELTMRQKVWKKLPGSRNNQDVQFADMEHNRRYQTMLCLLEILEDMTDPEYNKILERVQRRKDMEEQPVLDLFTPMPQFPLPGNDY